MSLVYPAIVSLDGFHSDASGSFAWAMPDEQVHSFVNEREAGATTYLYGRRMYEMMTGWENDPQLTDTPGPTAEFAAIWQRAHKIVYSTTLAESAVVTSRTRLERTFDPDAVRAVVAEAEGDVAIGGPTLAAHALAAGLVDRLEVYLCPVVVGGGASWLPRDVRLDLRLTEERRFDGGVVFCSYDVG